MKSYIAEGVGTFILVLIGCGAAALSMDAVGPVGVSLAFGLALMAVAYSFGQISGGHINPAVSLGMWVSGRLKTGDLIFYVAAQFAGAIAAGFLLLLMAPSESNLGANVINENSSFFAAVIFEYVATLLFVLVILAVTARSETAAIAGLIIGLFLAGIHLMGFGITGVSVNPARSFGPMLFSGQGAAYAQILIFLIVPALGGLTAGFLVKTGVLDGRFDEFTASIKSAASNVSDRAKSATKKS